jgi:site-specific recombinase XerD
MKKPTNQMSVPELVDAVLFLLESYNYSKQYMLSIRYSYKQLMRFCESIGETHFTEELGRRFMREHYGYTQNTKPRTSNNVRRWLDMLLSYQQFGEIMLRRRKHFIFPAVFAGIANDYFEYLRRNFASVSTVRRHKISLRRLMVFLEEQRVESCEDITIETINNYIKMVLVRFSKRNILTELGTIRRFLDFLYDNNILTCKLSERLPKHRISGIPSHLPSVFTPDEVERLLSTIDTASPLGKRNYAILMVAAKLGLRACDIKNLRYENIDWEGRAIRITQVKTKEPLVLPLPNDVGWALINYIRHGRPISDAPELFIRVAAPFVSLQAINHVLVKAMRDAKIPIKPSKYQGLHALRYGLATEMLNNNTPIYVIQEVLGHVNAHTTKQYTAIDVQQLKACALEVPSV